MSAISTHTRVNEKLPLTTQWLNGFQWVSLLFRKALRTFFFLTNIIIAFVAATTLILLLLTRFICIRLNF